MSARRKLDALAAENGWHRLGRGEPRAATYFKWRGTIRVEVHLIFDVSGRLTAASVWHNERQTIRHQPGVRDYAERWLETMCRRGPFDPDRPS